MKFSSSVGAYTTSTFQSVNFRYTSSSSRQFVEEVEVRNSGSTTYSATQGTFRTNIQTQSYTNRYFTSSKRQTIESADYSEVTNGFSSAGTYKFSASYLETIDRATGATNGHTHSATHIVLTTTNTGIGETTLTTNETHSETNDSTFNTINQVTVRGGTTRIDNYTATFGTTSNETVGVTTQSETGSTTVDRNGGYIYFGSTSNSETISSYFESYITSTFPNSVSFFETAFAEVLRFQSTETVETTYVNYSTSQGILLIPADYTSSVGNSWTGLGTESSSVSFGSAVGFYGKYTLDTFIERLELPLEGLFKLTNAMYDSNWFDHASAFSAAFNSVYGHYEWEDSITSQAGLVDEFVSLFGSTSSRASYVNVVVPSYSLSYESIVQQTSSIDETFFIDVVIPTGITYNGESGTVAAGTVNFTTASVWIPVTSNLTTTFSKPTVLKTDPFNYITTVIVSTILTQGVTSSQAVPSRTQVNTAQTSNAGTTTDSNSFTDAFTITVVNSNYSSAAQGYTSMSNSAETKSSSAQGMTFSSWRTDVDYIAYNKAYSSNDNEFYAICPDFKKGYLGFSNGSFYGLSSTFLSSEDSRVGLITSQTLLNYNQTVLGLACSPIIDYEEFTITQRTQATFETFTFEQTGIFGDVGQSSSYALTTTPLTYSASYIPMFITSSSVINDKLKVYFYTIYPRDATASEQESYSNALFFSLKNLCSNSVNFRRDSSVYGGHYPLSSQEGTFYWRGNLSITHVLPDSSSILTMSHNNPVLSSVPLPDGNAFAVDGKAICYPVLGEHTYTFS